jgi:hypothetical protein
MERSSLCEGKTWSWGDIGNVQLLLNLLRIGALGKSSAIQRRG